ncbi:MAG: hypothetical protein V2I43_01195 [Parvularcula sp.]|jgi:UDP-N-acetylmuramoylalanine--D-glutamate ligase|nr:hypothetical protein [Parvularcula sp.]
MDDSRNIPAAGRLFYIGPPLGHAARQVLEARGYTIHQAQMVEDLEDVFAIDPHLIVFGMTGGTKLRAQIQAEAGKREIPCVADLTLLSALQADLIVPASRRVLISGSAGKSSTAAILQAVLGRQQREVAILRAENGYLNALGRRAEVLIFIAGLSQLRFAIGLNCMVSAILNLSEEAGVPVSQRAREAAAELLATAGLAIVGADDPGAQSLMMQLRKPGRAGHDNLVPVSGGATLADGYFPLERKVFAIRNGRTRRVANIKESASLVGDHFGQDTAVAAAVSAHLGLSDEQIEEGLLTYQGLSGRFDLIGTDDRLVFVDDRHAVCRISAAAAITACPDVFWIGHRTGDLSKKVKAAARGFFYLAGDDGEGPPVDGVVTFANADDATAAAIRAARELLRRDARATPVVLFSPGAPGFERAGEAFRVHALGALSQRGRRHG